ncbi:hypothetical protein OIO89_01275 (plasmid) [Mycobacterium ulcerans]|nr:hypothetical protein OIO89_01275 [Mycobacterium ulcerans]
MFAHALDACDAALQPFTGWSVLAVLHDEPEAPSLERSMWSSCVVLGDGVVSRTLAVGRNHPRCSHRPLPWQIAAAHVAGALTLPEAAAVVALRSRVLTDLAGAGAMASQCYRPRNH